MKLGEFIENFSHNNVIRLVYKNKGSCRAVLDDWNDVSMDWEVNHRRGKFRHFINNEVLGLAAISFGFETGIHHTEAINIIIEEIENQPFIEEVIENNIYHESNN